MVTTSEMIFGIALPALLSLVALLLAWPPLGARHATPGRWWGAPIGLALATSCAALGLIGYPLGKSATPTAYLSPYILLAGSVGFVVALSEQRRGRLSLALLLVPFALLFSSLLALSIAPLLTAGSIGSGGEALKVGGVLLLLGCVLAAGALRLGNAPGSDLPPEVPAVLPPLVLFMVTVATSILLVLSGIISLAILCGALAATLGPAAVGALIRKDLQLGSGVKFSSALILSGLLAQGYLFGEMVHASGALVAFAPFFAVTTVPSTGAKGALFRIFAVSIVLTAALLLAAQAYFAEAY